jgi:hypothetical protein
MKKWYEVYENAERGYGEEQTIAFCAFKYSAETIQRYFCYSEIREVFKDDNWHKESINVNE